MRYQKTINIRFFSNSSLKTWMNAYWPHLIKSISYSFQYSTCLQELKLSEVIPFYKKLDMFQEENCKPVTILPYMSNVFGRIIRRKRSSCMSDKLADYMTGFRKSNGIQHSLIMMLQKWKRTTDKRDWI